MNPRQIVRVLLLVVVFGSVGVAVWRRREVPADPGPPQLPSAQAPAALADPIARADVVVTYFTTDVRCESCRTIEALSQRAVVEGFPQEVAAGTVVFRVVNTDEPQHRHFVDHYAITNKIVIVSRQHEGKEVEWTALQDVWLHLDEPATFLAYVREPIQARLAAR